MIKRNTGQPRTADPLAVSPQEKQRRGAAVTAMLRAWLADRSGYDEAVLPSLQQALNQNREAAGEFRKTGPMIDAVVLDSGPLGILAHPRPVATIVDWQQSPISAGVSIAIPEIADYEVRRELLRSGHFKSIDRLNELAAELFYLPLSTEVMQLAAEYWAHARQTGQPTAHDRALDGDMILAAQANWLGNFGHDVVVATLNTRHLENFTTAKIWHEIQL